MSVASADAIGWRPLEVIDDWHGPERPLREGKFNVGKRVWRWRDGNYEARGEAKFGRWH